MLEQIEVCLGTLQGLFRVLYFAGGGGSLLLQPAIGVEVSLRDVAGGTGLDQLRTERDDFFLRAAVFCCGKIGLRGFHLCSRTRGLAADIGVIEFQQQLTFVNIVAFLDQKAFYGGGDRSMGFEILQRLDLAVGGYYAADRATLHGNSTDFQGSLVEIGIEDQQKYDERGRDPDPPPARRCVRIVSRRQPVFFQGPAGTSVSSNLPFRRPGQNRWALHERCLF